MRLCGLSAVEHTNYLAYHGNPADRVYSVSHLTPAPTVALTAIPPLIGFAVCCDCESAWHTLSTIWTPLPVAPNAALCSCPPPPTFPLQPPREAEACSPKDALGAARGQYVTELFRSRLPALPLLPSTPTLLPQVVRS